MKKKIHTIEAIMKGRVMEPHKVVIWTSLLNRVMIMSQDNLHVHLRCYKNHYKM